MEKELTEIKKGISDIKIYIIIVLLVSFMVSSVFVWIGLNRKLDDISYVIQKVDDKTLDLTKIAE